ncbi:MAG: alpha-glucan family phosphorylase [Sneathiellaceae bacterium]
MSAIAPYLRRTRIAYFSMEIGMRAEIPTYSGGLGVLAGDTARSCADLDLPMVFVTLASRAGYFRQRIDGEGRQVEEPDWWDPAAWCRPLDVRIAVPVADRQVWVRPWLYRLAADPGRAPGNGPAGAGVPVLLLDTDLDLNDEADRQITQQLYGGDAEYRLKQEIVLGLGGLQVLHALGFDLHTYHLNEGHAALLTLGLLNRWRIAPEDRIGDCAPYDVAEVRRRCVFTTHTPVEAGHDRFSHALFERLLPGLVEPDALRSLAGADCVNMTRRALNLSGFVNGVARRHARTTEGMFPGYRVHAITNGVHLGSWAHDAFARLYEAHFPDWRHEPELLVRALQLPEDEVWRCHQAAKAEMLDLVAQRTGARLDPALPVLAFSRRMTGYKRPDLLFSDIERLRAIAGRHPFQVVMAGKAHPRDQGGKEAIRQLHGWMHGLADAIPCAFVPGYDMAVGKALVAGADIWLNTPVPPLEASGTSGMKAALNGVLNLSTVDGWWVEGCMEGITGWAIGEDREGGDGHAGALYDKLEQAVLPLYAGDPGRWRWMMKQAIAYTACYFNSHRMVRRYATEAYLR